MNVNYINPFIDATIHVLNTIASTNVEAGKPYIKKEKIARGDVSGVIGLMGGVKGTISVSFTQRSILSIVSNMFGEEVSEINDEISDAVGEISNMISGQARKKLDEQGKSIKAAIPSVVTGKNHTITHITNHPILAIPFNTDNGDFTIEVCFEEQ